jgi:2-oxoglutarate ferredoxin oxidoreductase subunit alpha
VPQPFTIGIAGAGGDGVVLLGELLARTAASAGLHCFLTKSFSPQIRGGESSVCLTIAGQRPHCPGSRLDLLAVLDWDGLAHFRDELLCSPHALALADARGPADTDLLATLGVNQSPLLLPLEELALSVAGSKLARNMVLAGALLAALGWPAAGLEEQLTMRLRKHGADELARTKSAVTAGLHLPQVAAGPVQGAPGWTSRQPLDLLTGNLAIALGALGAGCRFMAGYPISPATEILEELSRQLPLSGGRCVQAEDEIAAAGLALGAAYGGLRSMTATSGPGLSLKIETIGLAVMAEQPLVVVDVQRCGPSTGIPTRPEQGDLNLALYGRHGDAPLPVIAPVSIDDCATCTAAAFDVADDLRSPVLVLSDQSLAQALMTVPPNLVPQAPAAVSGPVPLPEETLTGLEHTARGLPSSKPGLHQANCRRRAEKIGALLHAIPPGLAPARYRSSALPDIAGERIGLLTWGSSYGPVCAAADALAQRGLQASVYAPRLLFPFDRPDLAQWLDDQDQVVVVELNYSGQLLHYLRSLSALPSDSRSYSRAGGAPFTGEEVAAAVLRLVGSPAPETAG